jgi:hypothetical protein
MKMKFVTLLVLSWTWLVTATPADDYISQGRNDLAAQNVWGANTNFSSALALAPTNATANLLMAATRLLVLPQTPAGSNFLNQLGFAKTNRDLYNWLAEMPVDAHGNRVWPTSYNASTPIAFFRTNIMAALAASATNLANIKDPSFSLTLLASETTHTEDVTLDYGDVQLLRAMVAAGQFMGYAINAQNFSVVIPTLQNMSQTNGLTFQTVLALYPSLLTLANTNDLSASKGAFTNAAALYFAASDYIRNVRPPAAQALFILSDDATNEEVIFRTALTNALASLNGPATFDAPDPFTLNASNYLSGTKSLRSLLPKFNGDSYVPGTLPDYTFGGILLDEPAYLTETALRRMFPSYAGIYGGQVYDLNYGDPLAGNFTVFISTNRQATIVGYDYDTANGFNNTSDFMQYGGISAQFVVDPRGNWQFNSNHILGVSGSGWVDKNGSFEGELDFTNGDSVQLNGNALSSLGPFQNAAGNYSGSVTASGGGQVGTLQAILDASGTLIFCFFDNHVQNDGGQGQFASNNAFTMMSVNGATGSGSINSSTFQITGSVNSSGGIRSISMSRSEKVPFDMPPAITKNLPSTLTAAAGTNLTISFVATGSPPMCYQWYSNSIAIPFATTNVLVISNLQLSDGGAYSVTINNVVGETNSAVTLTVMPETILPTNQITAPAPGSQVSNMFYTVTGRAGDNVAVSNVWVQLNNGGWNPANTTSQWNNWTAQVTLIPGSNTIQAYAVDTSGNVSAPTNTVIFKYVVSAPLTVQLTGRGTVLPNDSNAVLQVGTTYSMTAVAVVGSGFAFTDWTGGTSLPLAVLTNGATVQFTMVSNLTLQANFTDTNRPALSIANLTAGQRLSNPVFMVQGTATDNSRIASVQYHLNGGTWTNATGTTNWSALLNLTPGTNMVAAFATDGTGNNSPTNSVSFDFVVTNRLQIRAIGLGTISPNYSNSWLEIGRNYSITSSPASGFVATNWVVSTNWLGGVATNNKVVRFMMASNLALQINFVDVTKPTNTITAPTNGQHMANALATIVGTAKDNWKVAGVWYQLNNGPWKPSPTSNGWTNWTTMLQLTTGTNTVKAYAMDLGGNFSKTNTLSVVSSDTFKLQLAFSQPMKSNGVAFSLQLSKGLNGHIQVSSNLINWTTLTNFTGNNTTLNFRDPAATNSGRRFYRAVVP